MTAPIRPGLPRLARPQLVAAGLGLAGIVAAALVAIALLGHGGPGPGPTEPVGQVAPSPREATAADVLPTPAMTDVALLVADPGHLTDRERQWLADIGASVGPVATIGYGHADVATLERYFTVFVIDQSPDLDPAVLRAGFRAGLTIHLIGPAATYQPEVAGR